MTKPFPAGCWPACAPLTRRQGDVVFETLTVGDLTPNLNPWISPAATNPSACQKEFAIARILLGSPGAVLRRNSLSAAPGALIQRPQQRGTASRFTAEEDGPRGSKAKIETIRSVGYRLAEEASAHGLPRNRASPV
ncbi:MAG: hypothetical protein ACLUE1_07630 [Adlercreutzia equolifaciens]